MGRLIYSGITSLDGYTEDPAAIHWSVPDEEVHRFVNDLTRPAGMHLLGRRMYETMVYWDTDDPGRSDYEQEFAAIWQAADKVVYSRTIRARRFDAEAVRELKSATDQELTIGGPELAAQAISGAGRRVPAVPEPGRGRGRETLPTGRGADRARAAGGTPLRERRGVPALRGYLAARPAAHRPRPGWCPGPRGRSSPRGSGRSPRAGCR